MASAADRGGKGGGGDEGNQKQGRASDKAVAMPSFEKLGLRGKKTTSSRDPAGGGSLSVEKGLSRLEAEAGEAQTGKSRAGAKSSNARSVAGSEGGSQPGSRAQTPVITSESTAIKSTIVTTPGSSQAKIGSPLSPEAAEFIPGQSFGGVERPQQTRPNPSASSLPASVGMASTSGALSGYSGMSTYEAPQSTFGPAVPQRPYFSAASGPAARGVMAYGPQPMAAPGYVSTPMVPFPASSVGRSFVSSASEFKTYPAQPAGEQMHYTEDRRGIRVKNEAGTAHGTGFSGIHIRNLPFGATEKDIFGHFASLERYITKVHRPPGTGWATIKFKDAAMAQTAIDRFNGTNIGRRKIQVKFDQNTAILSTKVKIDKLPTTITVAAIQAALTDFGVSTADIQIYADPGPRSNTTFAIVKFSDKSRADRAVGAMDRGTIRIDGVVIYGRVTAGTG